MKIPVIMAMLLGAASLFGQAAASYVGALGPATGFAARPINPAVHIHHKELASAAQGAQCKRTQPVKAQCPQRTKDGSFAQGKAYKHFQHTESSR